MPQRFGEWLIDQQDREDLIGDLARVPCMQLGVQKSSGSSSNEHKIWADIVIRIVEPGHIAAFNEAWQEFMLARQAAADAAAATVRPS